MAKSAISACEPVSKYGQIIGFATEAVSPGERIFGMILESASGKQTKREQLGLGDPEFTPWQIGWVMQLPVHLLVPLASRT